MAYCIYPELTKETLLSKISSYQIFNEYCDGFIKIGKAFKSPFRQDIHPSAYIIYYNGDLLFKDFGGNGESYRAIDFVAKLYNISYHETLIKINNELCDKLYSEEKYIDIFTNLPHKEKSTTIIKVKYRDWNVLDIEYWNSYGISIETLIKFNVHPISYFSINDYIYKADELAYSYDYYWEKEVFRRKIYQPLSKTYKWFSNGGAIVQGEGMLPKQGSLLIITSSLKDTMALYELGYIAIAPTSETSFLPTEYFKKQDKRFTIKVLFMDSDEVGIKRNIKLSEQWNIPYIYIPLEYKSKDISDLIKNMGKDKTKELLKQMLQEYEI